MAAMAMPPAMMAVGICFLGFSMSLANTAMASKPMKLNRMMDRYVRLLASVEGRNVAGDMSLAKPFVTA